MDWAHKPSAWRTRGALARAGGWLTILVSVALQVIVLVRDVGLTRSTAGRSVSDSLVAR